MKPVSRVVPELTPWKWNRGEGGWSSTIVRTPHPVCLKPTDRGQVIVRGVYTGFIMQLQMLFRFFQLSLHNWTQSYCFQRMVGAWANKSGGTDSTAW